MKWFEDIFSKSKLMIISGVLSIIAYLVLIVSCIISPAPLIASYLIFAVLNTLLLICYKKGETSCQKALAGAILGIQTYAYWTICSGMFGNSGGAIVFLEIFMTIFLTIMFINHLLLQIDHKGDKKIIFASQIMLIIAVIWQFVEFITQIASGAMYYDIINSFALLCTVTMINCMEARIQKYKARRAEAMAKGIWTEEERAKSKKIFKF